jgi:hypothetical protein
MSRKYRSQLEQRVAEQMTRKGVAFRFETKTLRYTTPHTYKPDFELENGVLVELKGVFLPTDRTKLIQVRQQNPEIDLRLVFADATTPLYTGSDTTYADWANQHGFQWAHQEVPPAWSRGTPKDSRELPSIPKKISPFKPPERPAGLGLQPNVQPQGSLNFFLTKQGNK